jgi:hypothetical protein
MKAITVLVLAASFGFAAPLSLVQSNTTARREPVPTTVPIAPSQEPTDLSAVNKKLAAEARQARRAQGVEVDTGGLERGVQNRLREMRAFCASQYARC